MEEYILHSIGVIVFIGVKVFFLRRIYYGIQYAHK